MASPAVSHDNPYIIGVPIDDPKSLFGRERLFDFVRDNLAQGAKVILLSGQRRMGKSSVLRHIPRLAGLPGYVFLPFDLQAATQVPLGELLQRIGSEILRSLKLDSAASALPSAKELDVDPGVFVDRFLTRVYESLGGQKLVLLLDEFDALHDESDKETSGRFFQYLQSVVYRDPNLYVITVVGRRLEQMPSLLTLFKGAPHQEIGLLQKPSATRQITRPAEGVVTYEPKAIDAVLALSAGHPYFTQLMCHVLFQRARDEGEWTITPAIVEGVVADAITAGEGGLTWFREGLEIPERVVFSAVAELREAKTRQRLEAVRAARAPSTRPAGGVADLLGSYGVRVDDALLGAEQRLVEWGFLREARDDESKGLNEGVVTVELVRRWLVQRYPVRREIWELERLSARAQRLYDQGVEKRKTGDLRAAIAVWNEAIEANPNHLHAVGELAEAYVDAKNYARATESYERAYPSDPARHKDGFLEAFASQARELIERNSYEVARDKLAQALTLWPGHPKLDSLMAEAEEGIRRSFAVQCPFFVGDGIPPEKFVGRKRLVASALHATASRGHVALSGEHGMGKTSVLQYLSSEKVLRAHGLDPAQVIPVYVNCQSISPFTPTQFWELVVGKLQERLGSTPGFLSLILARILPSLVFRSMQGRLATGGQRVVLLLDDFDTALRPSESYPEASVMAFLSTLRSAGAGDNYVSFAVTMHPRFKVPQAWLEAITELAGGNPALLQYACSLLYEEWDSGATLKPEAFSADFENRTRQYYRNAWQFCSPEEQLCLMLIALFKLEGRVNTGRSYDLGDLDGLLSQRDRELVDLAERGVIWKDADEDSYRFSSSIMEWWVIKEIENSKDQTELEQREKILLGMNRNQVDQIKRAIKLVWEQKQAIHSAAGYVGKLVGALAKGAISG